MKRIGAAPVHIGPLKAADSRWELAACSQVDPDLHHPPSDNRLHRTQIAQARTVCAACPLTGPDGPCLRRALEAEAGKALDRRHGIFAGTTPRQRHEMDKETV
jgi:WhiB family redox-sensing transcriptional regulator